MSLAGDTKEITEDEKYNKIIEEIITAIGLDNETKNTVISELRLFKKSDKFKLTENKEIVTKIEELKKVDSQLKDIKKEIGENYPDIIKIWESMSSNLVKLQGKIILENISAKNCTELINNVVKTLDTKLVLMNNILNENAKKSVPSTTTSGEPSTTISEEPSTKQKYYFNKYMKYKNKYLKLRELI